MYKHFSIIGNVGVRKANNLWCREKGSITVKTDYPLLKGPTKSTLMVLGAAKDCKHAVKEQIVFDDVR